VSRAALGLIIGAFVGWSHHQYNKGHKDGVAEVDAQWKAASDALKAKAAQSATRADDAAAARTDEYRQQAEDERKAVEDAQANGSSPIDVLFGG
jgi:hypothetical protein